MSPKSESSGTATRSPGKPGTLADTWAAPGTVPQIDFFAMESQPNRRRCPNEVATTRERTMRIALTIAALAGLTVAAAPALADIKIGTAGPLSNAEALFGNTWQYGMQLAIDEANAAGGINGQKLVLVRQDDQGDPKQGTLLAQKFCDDDSIVAVIADFNSGVTIPSS